MPVRLGRHALAAPGIGGEERPEVQLTDLLVMGLEGLPRRACGERLTVHAGASPSAGGAGGVPVREPSGVPRRCRPRGRSPCSSSLSRGRCALRGEHFHQLCQELTNDFAPSSWARRSHARCLPSLDHTPTCRVSFHSRITGCDPCVLVAELAQARRAQQEAPPGPASEGRASEPPAPSGTCPLEKSRTFPPDRTHLSTTRSALPAISPGDSPPGHPSLNRSQAGRSR